MMKMGQLEHAMYLGCEGVASHWHSHNTKLIFYDCIYEAPAPSIELKPSEVLCELQSLVANILLA